MPIFEYECPKCGIFDVFHLAGEKALTLCPTCAKKKRKTKVIKLVSASAFHLKGTGWYKTDYVDNAKSATAVEDNASSVAGKDNSEEKNSVAEKNTKSTAADSSSKEKGLVDNGTVSMSSTGSKSKKDTGDKKSVASKGRTSKKVAVKSKPAVKKSSPKKPPAKKSAGRR